MDVPLKISRDPSARTHVPVRVGTNEYELVPNSLVRAVQLDTGWLAEDKLSTQPKYFYEDTQLSPITTIYSEM